MSRRRTFILHLDLPDDVVTKEVVKSMVTAAGPVEVVVMTCEQGLQMQGKNYRTIFTPIEGYMVQEGEN